jgi:nicotinamide-nucleotide amidase
MVRAHLIAVGSELLLPNREDSNTVWLRERLFEHGIPVAATSVIGDDETALVRLLETVAPGAQLILVTGGLGPTEDDITKKALARCLRRSLRYDERVKERLEGFYAARGMKMPENNLRQALVPMGSRVLENRVGTAPGILMEDRGTLYALLPGPPREMQPMFDGQVLPLLRQKFGARSLPRRHLRLTGLPESAADQIAAPVYKKYKEIQTTILSKPGDIELILIGSGEAGAAETLDRLVQELHAVLHEYIYSTDGEPLEVAVGRLLKERRLTLSVAESCTGGLLAKRLTDVPGSSAYFLGGVVCYSNALKTQLAGVLPEILTKHGAVSSTTASALAAGIRRVSGSAASIAVTGIAGPSGGTPDKPVGLVYIGVTLGEKVVVKKFHFHGDRERVRFQSAQMGLEVLRRLLLAKAE